ncbi:MAG: HAMP domain-containing histidine kinase [Kofleriaceae bacterium]|nr:HAMP domain-containing histidine kinase [Kofleriaceae bacterium]
MSAKNRREAPVIAVKEELSRVGMRLASRLDTLRKSEDERPYYHYQNLFHDPRGLSEGKAVNPSPLVAATGDSLISVHFQIDTAGILTIPPVNEELAEFSDKRELWRNQEKLAALRRHQDVLSESGSPDARVVAMREMPEETPPAVEAIGEQAVGQQEIAQQAIAQQAPVQQQTFRQADFVQNMNANAVFQELRDQKKQPSQNPGQEALADVQNTSVEVAIHGFLWRQVELEGALELVALRRIESSEGGLSQGFVVRVSDVNRWVDKIGAQSYELSFAPSTAGDSYTHSVAIPTIPGWLLIADISDKQGVAEAEATGLRSAFLWRFVLGSLLATILLFFLVHSVAKSEQLARERSQFAAAAAHELRTPLASLQLYGDMLAEGLGDQNAKEKYARKISDEAQRLGRVVSNVLGFSQMERKGLSLRVQKGNVSNSVTQVVERMRHALETAGMTIETTIAPDIEAAYDDDALSRILQNLLDNSEKYSRGREERRLRVSVSQDQAGVEVEVSDSGPGLGRKNQNELFEVFTRNAGKDDPAGLGLGLALARALAEQQGGSLQSQKSPLGGASFVLRLPAAV